jgi:hypothetical protein
MKNTKYYLSREHINNARLALLKSCEHSRKQREKRIDEYNKDPKACVVCEISLPYEKKSNTFCSASCSAKFNNHKRRINGWCPTSEQKEKVSKALKGRPREKTNYKKYCKIFLIECKICGTKRYVGYRQKTNKTCGDNLCRVEASVGSRSYKNGKRAYFRYYNQWEDDEIILESSWEVIVAEALDANGVEWYRPKPIRWVDSGGKKRWYYPDFHIPSRELYLDPKNPFCMKQDEEKMNVVKTLVNVVYGDINMILIYINTRL